MTQETAGGVAGPPSIIYIIRHGEKPADPPPAASGAPAPAPVPPFGIDFQGVENAHSLLPRGWQRSGALTDLIDPTLGPLQAGLQTPATLLSPSYGGHGKTIEHRTYQTIQGLADRLGVGIVSAFAEGQVPQLAASVVGTCSGVVLICWEHDHIPALASALPTVTGTVIPAPWPDDRFDVIWTFTLVLGSNPAQYAFGQIPQRLLSGDADTVIS
jgi:hypothetical protein